ncbi:hypothetical protein PHAVU_008G073600 [Phaseolus vulgaris]|uniref:F-box domain-containing protein n=1 Tax=Phaseolus vulgaris TaxID=3885 RepID=V7B507_PHAVU|nr:hypothetical protein PHAVU_008G073600g [Phaseolus vulgaris]ESW11958.1 hypothetical protein PHAVU_008G073600g [Phaseolus vulgaris]
MHRSNSGGRKDQNDRLLYEILVTIFASLNIVDLAVASLVCKTWNKACRDPSLWHKLDLSTLTSYCFNTPPNKIGAYRRSTSKITQFFKHILGLSDGNTTCLIFNYYVYITDEQLITIAERTRKLKRVVLPKTGDFSRAGVNSAMKLWRGLESITITSAVPGHYIFPALGRYCNNITEMKFSCGCIFEEKHAEAMVKYTPNLKMLSIRSIPASMKALQCVLSFLEHLKMVNVCHSFIRDTSDRRLYGLGFEDLRNCLSPLSLGKLIYCEGYLEGGWCLRCQNGHDNSRSRQPYGPLEDVWREDEITSLASGNHNIIPSRTLTLH